MLICAYCRSPLQLAERAKLTCPGCSASFTRNKWGYFTIMNGSLDGAETTEDYAEQQHQCEHTVTSFLHALLEKEPGAAVLDVGCGIGASAAGLQRLGFVTWGIDLPSVTRFWASAGRDPQRFVAASALNLPFPDDSFDFVYSLGVIEHIGTVSGHCALAPDYREQRRQYAKELMRVIKPGGRVLIACPNKSFPIDIQHGPGDNVEPAGPIRSFIYQHTGINIHKTWGRFHLASYSEVRDLFYGAGGREFKPLPLTNYFGFGRFKKGFLRPFAGLAEYGVNLVGGRASFLNPYVMAQIRKVKPSTNDN